MALNSSPRKTVPLATGDEHRPRELHIPGVTKRVFYSSVVVEGSEHGVTLPDEIQELVVSLGSTLDDEDEDIDSSSNAADKNPGPELQFKRAATDNSGLDSVITELVTSERTYVRRLHILKTDYADPLRTYARSKDTAIIHQYEAKVLFGNIDVLIPVNDAFLADLEKMLASNGTGPEGDVGDVALKHFRELSGFEQYKLFYPNREAAQEFFEKEGAKRSSSFVKFINAIKYSSTDARNRIGLRELLMEPVQRIPRYTLLFRTMLKYMGPNDPRRPKIEEAMGIASKIALAEADDPTKRASTFHCMTTTIEGFPPGLYSSSRKFIDCIDVQDVIGDTASTPSASGSTTVLHCTLLLFDDKLLIVKRPNGDKGVRTLTGLDNLDKVTKGGSLPSGRKKSGMSTKAVLDITDVVASDPGGASIHLWLEKPPLDQSERWSGRPFRSLLVVHPPSPPNFDPVQTEAEKKRFLENLWEAQAKHRAAGGKSVVLFSQEEEVENRASRRTLARTYYNVYTRTSFLRDPKKTKVVVHIDPMGTADPIPFGIEAPPYVCIRLQPISGGLCRFSVTSTENDEPPEEDIVQMERVPSRIVHTIHQFGLFQHRTGGKYSVPGTPTATRSKASIFGLDSISRNLFSSRPASAMGDFFGGTITSHRRTKSATSRSSVHTQQTNSTADSSLLKSTRTASTAATSVDGESWGHSSRSKNSRKGRGDDAYESSSAGGGKLTSESLASLTRSLSRTRSRDRESCADSDYSDTEEEEALTITPGNVVDSSDHALQLRLDLARQNSLQHGKPLPPLHLDIPVEETIYEEEPPQPVRMPSLDAGQWHLDAGSRSKNASMTDLRPLSRQSARPGGPRSPSPLPPGRSSSQMSHRTYTDGEGGPPDSDSDETTSDRGAPARARASGIPRSRRQIFPSAGESTPRASTSAAGPSSIEPLSIKKKSNGSLPSSSFPSTPTPATRRSLVKDSPLNRGSAARHSPVKAAASSPPRRDVSPPYRRLKKSLSTGQPVQCELVDGLVLTASLAKEQIEASQRALLRVKTEAEKLPGTTASNSPQPSSDEPTTRPGSPDKTFRFGTPPPTSQQTYVRENPILHRTLANPSDLPGHHHKQTKEAQQRLDEMRSLINRRQGSESSTPRRTTTLRAGLFEDTPKGRDRSGSLGDVMAARLHRPASGSLDRIFPSSPGSTSAQLREHATEAEQQLAKALETQESLHRDLKDMAAQFKEKLMELERTRLELANAKRQTELVKHLLADATAEKEIMYEAFNEELDAMFNDAHRPDDEAFNALSQNLQRITLERNEISRDKSLLKRQVAEAECQRDEWGEMLRSHGLLP